MYCKKCGAQIKEGEKVCQKCGMPIDPVRRSEVPETGKSSGAATNVPKKRHTKMVLIIVIIFVLIIAAAAFMMNRKPTIDLNKYTKVTYEGYDGHGEAEVKIDYGAINEDYAKKVKVMTNSETFWFVDLSVGEVLPYLVTASIDVSSGLSNGDQITISYQTEEEMKEILDCKIKCREETVTVEGLEEIRAIDVFTGVEVNFSGTAPHGKADLKTGEQFDEIWGFYSWNIDPYTDLSNGDTVTVSLEVQDEDAFIQKFGGMPKDTVRTYTVAGLDSYVTDMSQLSSENIEALRKEANEQLEATCANTSPIMIGSWIHADITIPRSASFEDVTLENIYFLTEKDSNEKIFSKSMGIPVLLYKLTAKVFDSEGEERKAEEIYFTVAFTELVLEEDGDLVGIATNSVERYDAIDEAYKKWVTGKKDNYKITIYDANLQEVES